ncbi:oxidoreductase, partial [Pseudomonas sp. HMWF007]
MLRKTLLASLCAGALISVPVHAAAPKALQSEQGSLEVTTLAQGLEHPWALAFLPDRQGVLVTERPGNLRVVAADGKLSAPIDGVPEVWAKGQGGLLDVVLSPDFKA